jgi:O-antigen ligase
MMLPSKGELIKREGVGAGVVVEGVVAGGVVAVGVVVVGVVAVGVVVAGPQAMTLKTEITKTKTRNNLFFIKDIFISILLVIQ